MRARNRCDTSKLEGKKRHASYFQTGKSRRHSPVVQVTAPILLCVLTSRLTTSACSHALYQVSYAKVQTLLIFSCRGQHPVLGLVLLMFALLCAFWPQWHPGLVSSRLFPRVAQWIIAHCLKTIYTKYILCMYSVGYLAYIHVLGT